MNKVKIGRQLRPCELLLPATQAGRLRSAASPRARGLTLGYTLAPAGRVAAIVPRFSAFTLSRSITLTLATLGYVHVPEPPVEAAIALSIAFVAAEILHVRTGGPGITARAPWLAALTFGL